MDVNRTSQVAAVALLLAVFPSLSIAQSSHSNYDPAAQQQSSRPRDSFVDFTLKRINRSDTDYGQCLTEGRTMLLEEAIKNGYFWSNLTALSLLGCLFIIIVYQHRIQTRREWTTSEMLAKYEQALARSNRQIEEATRSNRSLTESLVGLKQSAMSQPIPAGTEDRTPSRVTPSHAASTPVSATTVPKGNGAKATTDRARSVTATPKPEGQIALFKPEVELVTKVNTLEQQLGRSHELETLLRRQLNETGRQLQAEQERNRSLKGN